MVTATRAQRKPCLADLVLVSTLPPGAQTQGELSKVAARYPDIMFFVACFCPQAVDEGKDDPMVFSKPETAAHNECGPWYVAGTNPRGKLRARSSSLESQSSWRAKTQHEWGPHLPSIQQKESSDETDRQNNQRKCKESHSQRQASSKSQRETAKVVLLQIRAIPVHLHERRQCLL